MAIFIFTNFKGLSAKQFKTYIAVILISILSLQTLASTTDEGKKMIPSTTTLFEGSLDEELAIETWMTSPFEVSLDEELEIESWMITPFEVCLEEELSNEELQRI